MKFVPRVLSQQAADASRGHDRSPLRELSLLLLAVGGIFLALYLVIVLIVDLVVTHISPQSEARVFSTISESLPQPQHLQPKLEERLQTARRLLTKLQAQTDLDDTPLRLVVWEATITNAVAVPGGTIAVTTGLLRSLDDTQAMAFVLAHEIGHFEHRDHLRGLGRQVSFQVVKALLFSSSDSVPPVTDQAGALAYLSHSRKAEAAADRFALELVHRTFGSAAHARDILKALDGSALPGWAYMFSSHPAARERIEALRQYEAALESNSDSGGEPKHGVSGSK